MFYKVIENGVITSLHQSAAQPPNGEQITNEKYNEILTIIRSRPEDTLESVYKLMNASEQYEPFARTHEQTVDWYVGQVLSGQMEIDAVPADYKAEVWDRVEASKPVDAEQQSIDALVATLQEG